MIDDACARGEAISVGLQGNGGELLPEMVRRGVKPDLVTDQTSAHDPVNGYLPIGWTMEQWETTRTTDPDRVAAEARKSMAVHVRAMLDFHGQGIDVIEWPWYGPLDDRQGDVVLEEGMCFSYHPRRDILPEVRKTGINQNIVITKDGAESLAEPWDMRWRVMI